MDRIVQNIRKRIGETVIYGVSGYMKRNGLVDCPKYKEEDWRKSDLRGVRIYEEEWTGCTGWSRYMKRNGLDVLDGPERNVLDGLDVLDCPKYKEEDWRTVIYGVSGYMKRNGLDERIGERVIYGESGYMKRNGLDGLDCPKYKEEDWRKSDLRGVRIYEEEWTGWTGLSKI